MMTEIDWKRSKTRNLLQMRQVPPLPKPFDDRANLLKVSEEGRTSSHKRCIENINYGVQKGHNHELQPYQGTGKGFNYMKTASVKNKTNEQRENR